ncbi:hypothetical protein E5720_16470 [Rhodococcus sp. PAMC28707]|uniref:nSTAND1 domain-containing NTPase n=1 Tax=unclassified Rhodococcus (in: high G+C Gram-positive bacteria) TaxID=192944 RepID=UPI00109DF1A3|nr:MULTISPECIES: restriction endonuclease [unclassified Rhodococcus (in: high G+C Gram-positive bacteria)]QCB51981.1 hypothetical protein E5769_19050 [Rhodococcus sp. PAMC28705]QCB59849.1 hypothetical protein E5720_16470 [Rhodococcus sp. PAMC28707]
MSNNVSLDGLAPHTAEMPAVALSDPAIIVLAEGDSTSAVNNARGHIFEKFVAQLLHAFGYSKPTRESLNVTANGIEIDVVATHELSAHTALAECKAYTSAVSAAMLGTFHSKVVTRRYTDPATQGFFVAIPRLTSNGQQLADLITKNDNSFRCLTSRSIVAFLKERRTIVDCPIDGILQSDPAVIVSAHGVYSACIELDRDKRTPLRVLVWGTNGTVPEPLTTALSIDPYSQERPVVDAHGPSEAQEPAQEPVDMIVTVNGSQSDFEYQLPASPRFFVGRKSLVRQLENAIDDKAGVVVLNAQSGWGKSSAALRLQSIASERSGCSLIIDSRTATHRRFVTDSLRVAAQKAHTEGVLMLPANASWGSLSSAAKTLADAAWTGGPLIVFFDQFENVFRDESLTREFRDLALTARDLSDRILIGFAWKTDLVGWTESHPYQLRDDIRSNATVLTIGPLGASEIDTLLRRLEKEIDKPLAKDLKTRLREYSQGLPWLFKKLAGHLIREIKSGASQERLASEALNVQGLFDADLAELGPTEQEALRHIARYAPIAISEVMERVTAPVVESLVNRRLVVQVGERLDTYWDIFRDYLNNGRIPVEDSYILRQSPNSVARLLREVRRDDGDSSVPDIAGRLGTSENAVFNLSRELRLLGTTTYEPNRVQLLSEIWNSADQEAELRRRVSSSLRRHRSYSAFLSLAERLGNVSISSFSKELPSAFPAVEVSESTWTSYARVHLQWFEYSGLAETKSGISWTAPPEGTSGSGSLLGAKLGRRSRGGFPHDAPRPSMELLLEVSSGVVVVEESRKRALRPLLVLNAVEVAEDGTITLAKPSLIEDGRIDSGELLALMKAVPGVQAGLNVLEQNPSAPGFAVGSAVRSTISAQWTDSTTKGLGGHLRSWARFAGVKTLPVPRKSSKDA